MYYDKDADLSLLQGKTIAIIGYGSQGHAHAQNARDNGCKVIIGLHAGSSRSKPKAEADGFEVYSVAEATAKADIVMVLIHDTIQGAVYADSIGPNLKPGSMLMFAHGFWMTNYMTLIGDIFPAATVATVVGLTGSAGGLGGFLSSLAIGRIIQATSFAPVFIACGLLYPIGLAIIFFAVRRGEDPPHFQP